MADWEAYYESFRDKVRSDGFPDEQNVSGWSKQADVENLIADLAAGEGKYPGVTTCRGKAREFMRRYRRTE